MEKQRSDRRLIAGILLIALGFFLVLDIYDIFSFNFRYYLISWKTLLIGIGLIAIYHKDQRITGIVLISLGIIFWLPEFYNFHISFRKIFWPLVLIGFGVILLSRRWSFQRQGEDFKDKFDSSDSKNDVDYIDDLALFGGGNRNIVSQNFKGGKVTAIFGGSEFNFKGAVPAKDNCVIDVFTVFGGSKFIVPDDWHIKTDVVSVFGGFSDKRNVNPNTDNPEKTLLIKGLVIFGGGEIKSY
ncbi:MAG: cell wall-active antibiotics response protein [Bacteroidales bacterium]|nr:cell wall-active antibiotics response protein [Bacteroidales bacterium]